MNIGFSKKDITGTLPVKLAGFAKERIAHEIHDELLVSCIVFETDQGDVVFYSLDLLNVDHLIVHKVRSELLKYQIDGKNIHLFATHTHSAPAGISDVSKTALIGKESFLGDTNEDYIDFIAKQCVEAYLMAKKECVEATVKIAKGKMIGIGKNRIQPERDGDESLFVVEIKQISGKRALLYNFACHPTVLNMDSIKASADLPGAIRNELKEYDVVLFVNGACGDISTRFTRESNNDTELIRYALLAKEAISETLNKPSYQGPLTNINCTQEAIPMMVKKALSIEEALAQVKKQEDIYKIKEKEILDKQALRLARSYVEGAMADLEYAKHHEDCTYYTLEVNHIKFQNENLVTIPAELFSELGNVLKKQCDCQIFGYANGYFLYIADQKAYEERTYEAASSPFEKGQGELLIQSIMRNLLKNT